MSLDIDQVAVRLVEASSVLAERERTRRATEAEAYARFVRDPVAFIQQKIEVSGDRLRLATPAIMERLTTRTPAATAPDTHLVIAADGSLIDIDRHRAIPCYVLNIGAVELQYGDDPRCSLTTQATLGLTDSDLGYLDEDDGVSLRRVDGQLLGVEQGIQELNRLADLLECADPAMPTLALVDGPLVIWGLTAQRVKGLIKNANEGDFIKRYQAAMDRIQIIARDRPLTALAGYVSFPGSDQVANLIRVAACPFPVADCKQECSRLNVLTARKCDSVATNDRALFARHLRPGERSGLFLTSREFAIACCYFHTGGEIARIELPEWVATDPQRLDMALALIADQVARGQGYPTALIEAHEQAVIHSHDRLSFEALLNALLAEAGLPDTGSAKAQSKRVRGV